MFPQKVVDNAQFMHALLAVLVCFNHCTAVWKVRAHWIYNSPLEEAVSKIAKAAARKLGYAALKKIQQQEVVVHFLSRRDVFAVLSTG